jgi:hypothetical protein
MISFISLLLFAGSYLSSLGILHEMTPLFDNILSTPLSFLVVAFNRKEEAIFFKALPQMGFEKTIY